MIFIKQNFHIITSQISYFIILHQLPPSETNKTKKKEQHNHARTPHLITNCLEQTRTDVTLSRKETTNWAEIFKTKFTCYLYNKTKLSFFLVYYYYFFFSFLHNVHNISQNRFFFIIFNLWIIFFFFLNFVQIHFISILNQLRKLHPKTKVCALSRKFLCGVWWVCARRYSKIQGNICKTLNCKTF